MKRKHFYDKIKSYLLYTLLFALVSCCLVYIFYIYNKGAIWKSDTVNQHYITFINYRNLLVNAIKTGHFTLFNWNLGLGMDLIANYSYYILGDLFSYVAVLFPESRLDTLFFLLIIVRLYFVGITFIFYARYKKLNNISQAIGGIMYSFCTFALLSGIRHPYFLNAVMIWPLVMIGIEKIINEDKKIFFIFSVFLLFFMTCFYFGYLLSVCLFIYGSILIFTKYNGQDNKFKKIVGEYFKVAMCVAVGVLMSMIVLLPTVMMFLGSNRSGAKEVPPYFIDHYRHLFKSLGTLDMYNWSSIGLNALTFLIIPLLFRRHQKYHPQIIFLLILFVSMLFSNISQIYTAFSWHDTRWSFVFSFILCSLSAHLINDGIKITKEDFYNVVLFAGGYLIVLFLLNINFDYYDLFSLGSVFIFLIIFDKQDKLKFKNVSLFNASLCILTVLTLCINTYSYLDVSGDGFITNYYTRYEDDFIYPTNNNSIHNFEEAIKEVKDSDKSFYRVLKFPSNVTNLSLIYDYPSIDYYYSIIPKYLATLGYDLANGEYSASREIKEFDKRTKITTLLGNKYYISDDEMPPYGYELQKSYEYTKIYENKYPVSFGTFYDTYIDTDSYYKLDPLEKESALLKTVSLDKKDIDTKYVTKANIKDKTNNDIKSLDFKVKDEKIPSGGGTFTVSNTKKGTVTLNFDSPSKSGELYLRIKNIAYEPFSKDELYDVKITDKSNALAKRKFYNSTKYYTKNYEFNITTTFRDIAKRISYVNKNVSPYVARPEDFLVNLGYYEDLDEEEIQIKVSSLGNYNYDDIEILLVNFDDYESDVAKLNEANFEIDEYYDNTMKAKVNFKNSGVLQLSTAYSKGWKVLVDGKKTDTFLSNNYFLGIYLDKGEHEIELIYETPYLKVGALCSVIGIVAFGVIIYYDSREGMRRNGSKKRKREK